MLQIAGEVSKAIRKKTKNRGGSSNSYNENSQADRLVKLANKVELFHTPGAYDSEGYATVSVDTNKGNSQQAVHRETWPINSKAFRKWLVGQFYKKYHKVPSSQPIQDALTVIAGKAIHEDCEHEVAVRLAEHSGAIWLNLANSNWQAVKISASGWQVVSSKDVPVRFIRKRGMLPLPVPEQGGKINDLRPFMNLPDDNDWVLLASWVVAAMRPKGPYPILVINGEQGSAKSTLCRLVRALIDPNKSPLRRPPKDDRDLMIAATNSWIVAYDNLSGLSPNLSDALCSLATGAGFAVRQLYTDDDEKIFDAMRPIMINGITDLTTRPDLMDRSVHLILPTIPGYRRKTEGELLRRFEQARPRILGALLDAVSIALKNLPTIDMPNKPRMADFAMWATAAEPALGFEPGRFMAVYAANMASINDLAIETMAIGPAVKGLMYSRNRWTGIAQELLTELCDHRSDEKTRKRQDWPKTPRALAGQLRRLAPNLRAIGINVTFHEPQGHYKRRIIVIEYLENQRSASAASPADSGPAADCAGHAGPENLADSNEIDTAEEITEWKA